MIVSLAGLIMAAAVQSQAPPPAMLPPSWVPRDPVALPGDNLPPPMSVVVGAPPPINPNANRPPPPPGPALDLSVNAAQAALAKCRAEGFEVGVAISNSVGGLIVGLQAERAFPGRVYNAVRKNLAAIEFGTATSAVRAKLRASDKDTLARVKPNMTLLGGAIPLFADGKVIGAIGVSGAPAGEIDEVCASAGAAVFAAKP